jgi:hypothetical protein
MRRVSRTFAPQYAATGLSPDAAYRIELAGPLRRLAWPGLCPSCGATASTRLPVTKVFARDWYLKRIDRDDVRLLSYQTIEMPLCEACASRHGALVERIGLARWIASYFATTFIIPLLVAVFMLLLYVDPTLLGPAADLVAAPKRATQTAVVAAFAAANAWLVWHQTRRWRLPPQTEVTLSFDFSDTLGEVFGREHRVYAMSNRRFAEAFTAANADRVWKDRQTHGG